MMITLDRFNNDSDATLSKVSVDGWFVCFGLEDEYRADEVANETRTQLAGAQLACARTAVFVTLSH